MQLLAEQVNTEVAVLASRSRGRDTDDLAGATLEHQDITHTDVVARNGDGVGNGAIAAAGTRSGGRGVRVLANHPNTVILRVEDTVGHLV